jgi:hypothetical protein
VAGGVGEAERDAGSVALAGGRQCVQHHPARAPSLAVRLCDSLRLRHVLLARTRALVPTQTQPGTTAPLHWWLTCINRSQGVAVERGEHPRCVPGQVHGLRSRVDHHSPLARHRWRYTRAASRSRTRLADVSFCVAPRTRAAAKRRRAQAKSGPRPAGIQSVQHQQPHW